MEEQVCFWKWIGLWFETHTWPWSQWMTEEKRSGNNSHAPQTSISRRAMVLEQSQVQVHIQMRILKAEVEPGCMGMATEKESVSSERWASAVQELLVQSRWRREHLLALVGHCIAIPRQCQPCGYTLKRRHNRSIWIRTQKMVRHVRAGQAGGFPYGDLYWFWNTNWTSYLVTGEKDQLNN